MVGVGLCVAGHLGWLPSDRRLNTLPGYGLLLLLLLLLRLAHLFDASLLDMVLDHWGRVLLLTKLLLQLRRWLLLLRWLRLRRRMSDGLLLLGLQQILELRLLLHWRLLLLLLLLLLLRLQLKRSCLLHE